MDDLTTKNLERVDKMLALMEEPRRKALEELFAGPFGANFFSAPASTRKSYHCCFDGGLMDHSIRVATNLRKVTNAITPGKFDVATVVFVGLVHDFGKAGDGEHPFYVKIPDGDWRLRRTDNQELYEYDKACPFMPHSDMSLYVLQKAGVRLTTEEFVAIRTHDGLYEESNRRYAMKEPPLALYLHWADMQSVLEEKELYK